MSICSDASCSVRIVGNTFSGCSSNPYQQFNPAAFNGPLVGSDGLESRQNYLTGCFQSVCDLSIARNIRLPKGRTIR